MKLSLLSCVLTHNVVLLLSGAVIDISAVLISCSRPAISIEMHLYHLLIILLQLFLNILFSVPLSSCHCCAPLSHPITFPVFANSQAPSCHRFMSLISLSVSTESSATTPSVWTPWINLSCCHSVQKPLDHKISQ